MSQERGIYKRGGCSGPSGFRSDGNCESEPDLCVSKLEWTKESDHGVGHTGVQSETLSILFLNESERD